MAALFHILFSCCFRSDPSERVGDPDETSHLIPVLIDPSPDPSANPGHASDQQKTRERFGNIVHSTQSNMVNVTAHLPFNLHNSKLYPRSLDPSSSRSQSSN